MRKGIKYEAVSVGGDKLQSSPCSEARFAAAPAVA